MTTTVRCPDNLVLATDGRPIIGCGTDIPDIRDDEGWVDCPNCGLGFNPDHPENRELADNYDDTETS